MKFEFSLTSGKKRKHLILEFGQHILWAKAYYTDNKNQILLLKEDLI